MASMDDVKHLSAKQLEDLFDCEDLKQLFSDARSHLIQLKSMADKLLESVSSTTTMDDKANVGLALMGLVFGIPTFFGFGILSILSGGTATVSLAFATFMFHRKRQKIKRDTNTADYLVEKSKECEEFLNRCQEAKVKKGCK
jgi:hypothetical protein